MTRATKTRSGPRGLVALAVAAIALAPQPGRASSGATPSGATPGEAAGRAVDSVRLQALASLYIQPWRPSGGPAASTLLRERSGYWNGVPDDALLHRIQRQPIKKVAFNLGGSSLSLRLFLADGSSAAFKPEQIHTQTVPRKEIAAYRLNRLLGLARVPPATWRVVSLREIYRKIVPTQRHLLFRIRKEARFRRSWRLAGEVSWWIPRIKYVPIDRWKARKRWYQWLKAYKRLPTRFVQATAQLSVMLMFDFLINNPDRFSGYNTMSTPDEKFLYFMDNTYSFFPSPRGGRRARNGLHRTMRFSRRFYQSLKALTPKRLRAAMRVRPEAPFSLLTDEEIRAVIARRYYAVQHINRVIARYGWAKTMVFP